jgi:hypothetical protein
VLKKLMLWVKRKDEFLSMINPRSWKSAMGLHVPLCTTALGVTKFLQSGYRWAQTNICENINSAVVAVP